MGASIQLVPVPSAVTSGAPGMYTRGEELELNWSVKNTAGVLTAPTDLTFTVRSPDGVDTDYVAGSDAEITDNADGTGTLVLVLDQSARWFFRCVTDTPTTAAETDVIVQRSALEDAVIPVPGDPGAAYNGAIARAASGVYSPYLATEDGEQLTARASGSGFSWQKRRGWIVPDIDLTGAVDATSTIAAALLVAGDRPGSCVYLPEGIIKIGTSGVAGPSSIFTVPPAVTLVGPERGFRLGHRHFAPLAQAGALLNVYGTGKLFTQKYDSTVGNLEIYYPDQVTAIGGLVTAPAVYDWTFYVAADEHGTTTFNITPINPNKFYYCSAGGAKLSDVLGYPLRIGVHLARCPAVIKATNVSFYPANDSSQDPTLLVWTHANARAWLIDGAEGYDISSISMGPYNVGIQFVDEDGDAFKGCYGRIAGADIEAVNICVHVPQPTGLVEIGGKFSDCIFAPELAVGHAVLMGDNFTPADHRENPGLHFVNCSNHSGTAGSARDVWLQSNSHGLLTWTGGVWHSFLNEGLRNDSANARARLINVGMPSASTRTAGTGSIADELPYDLD